uniref:Uncharacterized protein n=1 Tax=Lepeophtheirus salmonis TaxID=72036 RepID=A0A0K2UDZ5_LEPSM
MVCTFRDIFIIECIKKGFNSGIRNIRSEENSKVVLFGSFKKNMSEKSAIGSKEYTVRIDEMILSRLDNYIRSKA